MRRDSSLKKRLGSLANSLTKKTRAETVRSLKSDTLAQLEVTLDSVEDVPFAQGGQGEVAGVEWRDASEVAAAWASGDAGFVPRTAVYGAILSEALAGLAGAG